ncbi:MAG: isoleucine--tRNA ligase [Gammaproteobacteria bacterium]|nr:isoleucine--tRNA ligase [Gammaproteobacteria bacterium]
MRANLAQREPAMLQQWNEHGLYQRIRENSKGRPKFLLADGPPYANGSIHMGHAVNKVLKDIIIKFQTLDGRDAPYIPGWDCHGLPIEHQVEKKHGRFEDKQAFREACRAYAMKQVDQQRKDFIRLGVLGDWENPYLTMLPRYEAGQLRALGKIISRGHVFKGYKPVHWCLDCRSALAEAEVEYQDKTSPSIDVRFAVVDTADFEKRLNAGDTGSGPISVPIWTTTPWTIPGNQAVALHPDISYTLLQCDTANGTERFLIATDLVDSVVERIEASSVQTLSVNSGSQFAGVMLKHPLYAREVPLILGDHVTLDAGTGAVHTAPGHGIEDFAAGLANDLPLDNPVGADGCFLPGTEMFAGQHVLKANKTVVAALEQHKALLKHEPYQHSYPHCWRHKSPLIFRATPQWFISMDGKQLRAKALAEIKKVRWTPDWAEQRIEAMVDGRPDWCISRQRVWGVPIAVFAHRETNELHPDTVDILEKLAARIGEDGPDSWAVWQNADAAELIGDDAANYEKVTDTMDVWFDSGCMHFAASQIFAELESPADLYLEGSDQHRGWFQSSMLTSVAMNDHAPYRGVLTHGFAVDEHGRKMSKSIGNVIEPQKIVGKLGADILRLWVAAADYRGEIHVSDEIMKRLSDSYRRMRNTSRFLLGNLHGFEPGRHEVAPESMLALDRWALDETRRLQDEVIEAYRNYEFHLIYQKVHNFCVVKMGGFYLDIIKDRLYTMQADSVGRRSAQTAMYHIAEAIVRWLAPILSFTAEEIWAALPAPANGERSFSVQLSQWHAIPQVDLGTQDWQTLIAVRDAVNRELERARTAGTIGSALDAEVDLYCDAELADTLRSLGGELRFLLISSSARVNEAAKKPETALAAEEGPDGLWISVKRSDNEKCERCWHRRPDVGSVAGHENICARCVQNVDEGGEDRQWA